MRVCVRSCSQDKQNAAQLRECCDILCRYSWTLLSETDLFADAKYEQYEGVMQLFPVVLQTSSSEQARAFVASVLSNGGDAVATVVQPIFDRLSRRIATMQMTEPAFMQYMNTVALLTRTRLTPGNEVQVACSTLPSWTPGDANGALLERASFLGPLFRHTTLPDANVEGAKALMLEYFVPAIAERQPVDSHIASLQQTLAGANRVAFTVVRQMLGQQTRDRTLDWFAQVLNANADRYAGGAVVCALVGARRVRALAPSVRANATDARPCASSAKMYTRNEKVLSSEAFLTNVALSLMELCGPLLTLDSKVREACAPCAS